MDVSSANLSGQVRSWSVPVTQSSVVESEADSICSLRVFLLAARSRHSPVISRNWPQWTPPVPNALIAALSLHHRRIAMKLVGLPGLLSSVLLAMLAAPAGAQSTISEQEAHAIGVDAYLYF